MFLDESFELSEFLSQALVTSFLPPLVNPVSLAYESLCLMVNPGMTWFRLGFLWGTCSERA